jgi:hypothetical protein
MTGRDSAFSIVIRLRDVQAEGSNPRCGKSHFLHSSVFWVITRSKWFETDVSGLYICPIFKSQTVQEAVSNHLTPRNNPKDGIIQFNRG